MHTIIYKFKSSIKKMKQISTLTLGSMLVALFVLSSVFLDFYPSDSIKISFGFLFIATAGYLCGPLMAILVGGLGDFLTWVIHPHGALNVGITLCMMLMGLLLGLFYYNEKPSLPRCIIASVTETVLIELLCKTYALKALYGTSFGALFLLRLLPAGIMLILMILLTFSFFKAIQPIKARLDRNERARPR